MTILVLSPHPDDEVLGCGGTIAKYAAEHQRVVVVVFTTGTASHPLHKEQVITKTRKEEALASHKKLGVSESIFLMLEDYNLKEEIINKEIIPKLHEIIKKEKPNKIFMPALDDTHKDHRAVGHAMLQIYTQYSLTCRLYTYTIWNLAFLRRKQPRLVVDITDYYKTKIEAAGEYKSQWVSMYQHIPSTTIKAFLNGLRYGHRWAEVFIQLK